MSVIQGARRVEKSDPLNCEAESVAAPSTPPLPSQVNQLLEVGDRSQEAGSQKYSAMARWSAQLKGIHAAVANKLV